MPTVRKRVRGEARLNEGRVKKEQSPQVQTKLSQLSSTTRSLLVLAVVLRVFFAKKFEFDLNLADLNNVAVAQVLANAARFAKELIVKTSTIATVVLYHAEISWHS